MTIQEDIGGTTVRPALRGDIDSLHAMVTALAAHHGDAPRASRATLERDLFGTTACARALLAERRGETAGYAMIHVFPQLQTGTRVMELGHLFVRPEHRGHGLGRRLIAAAVDEARRQQCGRLVVGTRPDNTEAQAIYRGLGFEPAAAPGPRFGLDLPAGGLPAGWV